MKRIVFLLLLIPSISFSEVYRCTDENGKTVFSQLKCGDDAKTVTIKTYVPSADDRESSFDRADKLRTIQKQIDFNQAIRKLDRQIRLTKDRRRELIKKREARTAKLQNQLRRAAGSVNALILQNAISNTRSEYNRAIDEYSRQLREMESARAEYTQ